MNRKHLFLLLIVILVLVFFSIDADAQCAMCKKVAEGKDGKNIGVITKNLNVAILYLMAAPYVLLGLFFRKQIVMLFKKLKTKVFSHSAVPSSNK